MGRRFRYRHWWLIALFFIGLGCSKPESITVYENIEQPNRLDIRLLAAIIPADAKVGIKGQVFKLSGPKEEISRWHDAFVELVESARKKPLDPKAWKAPASWKREGPAPPIRVMAWFIPGNPDLECTLTVVEGHSGSDPLANVNRWRGQLTLPPLKARNLSEAGGWKDNGYFFVDISGFSDYTVPRFAPGTIPFKYEAPSTWELRELQDPESSLEFKVSPDCEVVISERDADPRFGTDPGVAELWRKMKLPPVDSLPKPEKLTWTQVTFVDLTNPDLPEKKNRLVGAVFASMRAIWVIELRGPDKEVAAQKEAFERFVKSLHPK